MTKFIPAKINADKSLLKNQAYDIIKNAIMSKELEHNKIYSQEFLGQSLGISRTPVREALLQLQNEGFITIHRGRGMQIIATTENDLFDILELSDAVECRVSRLAAQRANASVIAKLEKIHELQTQKAQEKLVDDFMEQDSNFHLTLALATGNKRLYESVELVNQLVQRSGFFIIYNLNQEILTMILKEHENIIAALKKASPDETEEAMRIHILGRTKRATKCFEKLRIKYGPQPQGFF